MNKRWNHIVWCSLLVLSAGCGQSPSPLVKQLPGAWQGTIAMDDAKPRGDAPDAQVAAKELEAMKNMKFELDFRPDGKLVVKGDDGVQPYTSEGTWELVQAQGNTVTIKSIEGSEEKMIDIRFDGNDQFSTPLKTEHIEGAMRFRRLR